MSEEGYRAAKEARADLAKRSGGSTASKKAVARMVGAAIYRYEHQPWREHHTSTPLPAVAPGGVVVRLPDDYRRAMAAAGSRLAGLRLATLVTGADVLRYVDLGTGAPVLLVHGIFGGSDAALRQLAPLVPHGSRMIAPSRFGYLGSTVPAGAGPDTQADAYVTLLDRLGVERVAVLAASAGATSALRLAIRHPDRVSALVLVSPNAPGVGWGSGPVKRLLARRTWGSNRLMWLLRRHFPGVLRGLMGVPRYLPLTAADHALVDSELDGIFPVDERSAGAWFDAFVSNPDIDTGYAFGRIVAPTIVAHARDDTLVPFTGAVRLADTVPGARLLAVDRGGHLMLGDHAEVIAEIRAALRAAV